MISTINYSLSTQVRPNQTTRISPRYVKQNPSSPSFKGGALIGFVSYTLADYFAILVGCSSVDAVFRKVGLRDARDFGVRVIKRKYPAEYAEISNLTAHISNQLKQNSKTKKAGKTIQKTYEIIFQQPLKPHEPIAKPKESIRVNLDMLYDKIEDLFVNMDDKDRFIAIGKPFLKTIEKILKSKDLPIIKEKPENPKKPFGNIIEFSRFSNTGTNG